MITVLLLTTGCSVVGPDFSGVDKLNIPDPYKEKSDAESKKITQCWKGFNDPVLNTLIQITAQENLDLKSAGLRILQARAVLGISEGLRYPQQQRVSGGAFTNRVDGNSFGTIGAGFDVGWEMDVWGKYARGIESSQATLYSSFASHNDIMVSVLGELARNYINYRTAEERIAYAKRNILIQEYVTKITKIQFNTGNVSELDMQQSLSRLYTTRSVVPSFQLQMLKAKNAMAVLMGISPLEIDTYISLKTKNNQDDFIQKNQNHIQLLNHQNQSLDISIIPTIDFDPSDKINANLLQNRPDLKVAEYIVQSRSADIGLTEAELYPSFTLLGSIGVSATNADGTWSSLGDSINISAGPSFSWNILQYGRIKDKVRLQDAIFEESLVSYNKKVLQAISEVSDAMNGYKLTKQQEKENIQAVNATVRAFNISVIQYYDGLVGYQRLLNSIEKLTRDQDTYAQIKGSLALNVISLYKALGGGWQMNQGKSYISKDMADKMAKRTDWGNYLDAKNTLLPKENKE